MDRFKSDTLKISVECISSCEIDKNYILRGRYSFGYFDNEQALEKIKQYKERMLRGEWWDAITVSKNSKYAWHLLPLVFMRDGTLYEGKHRLAALSLIEETITIPFVVITGWHDGLVVPMPNGKQGITPEVAAFWRLIEEAMEALNLNDWRETSLEGVL